MKIKILKKTDVLAEIMLIVVKLHSLVREVHDFKQIEKTVLVVGICKLLKNRHVYKCFTEIK